MPISSPSSVTVQRRMSLLTVNRSVSASGGRKSAAPVPRKVIFIDLSRFLRSPVCDTSVFPAKNAAEAHSGSCCASPALFHCSTIPEKMQKCFCHPDFRRAPGCILRRPRRKVRWPFPAYRASRRPSCRRRSSCSAAGFQQRNSSASEIPGFHSPFCRRSPSRWSPPQP